MSGQVRAATPLVRDIVCVMMIPPNTSAASSQVAGSTFYFRSQQCQSKFDAGPGQFVPELAERLK